MKHDKESAKERELVDKKYIEDVDELADYLGYYLSETVGDLLDWDCEHLAINMLRELKIEKPDWWDKQMGKDDSDAESEDDR